MTTRFIASGIIFQALFFIVDSDIGDFFHETDIADHRIHSPPAPTDISKQRQVASMIIGRDCSLQAISHVELGFI